MEKNFINNFYNIKKYVQYIDTQYITDKTHFAFQFDIIGEGEGVFYIEYNNDNIFIEPYDYYDHSARIQATSDTIIELMKGKININDAIRLGEINIINREINGIKKVIDFFDASYFSQKNLYSYKDNQWSEVDSDYSNPWENLRIYIEQSDIDMESKNQLLANLVKFTSNELHILIVGGCGCGKSSTINALFNMEIARVGYGVDAETQTVSVYKLDNLYLHDTPGLGESTVMDKIHIERIKTALQEVDPKGNAVIDVVLVIIDGSHRDMKSSFELINDVIIPNLQQKDRILIGINRCDMALDGKGWIERYNYPNEELLQRLNEKAESVRRRIKDDTGVDVEPVFYSALHKYNISKLLSYLVKSAPKKKRVFFAEKINKNPDNFLRDDTVRLSKKNKINKRSDEQYNYYTKNYNNSYYDATKLCKEVNSMKDTINGIGKKVETIQDNIKASISERNIDKKEETMQDNIKESILEQNIEKAKNSDLPQVTERQGDLESEYEFINIGKKQYIEEFKSSMEEGFEEVETEINKGSKEKIKLSFVNILDNMKQGTSAGAKFGKELGKNVPVIGATIGAAVGAVIGGVGGLISSMFGRKKVSDE